MIEWSSTRLGQSLSTLPPLTAAAAAMYGSGAVMLFCAAATWQPGKNPQWVITCLGITSVAFFVWTVVRRSRFTQVEALGMVSLQLLALTCMTWTTHLTFGALANGTLLPIVGVYIIWFLRPVSGRIVLYSGVAGWFAAILHQDDSALVPFAFTIVFQTIVATEVFSRVKHRMDQLARTDPLTGTLNRRGITEVLENEMARAMRRQQCLSVVAIDVDGLREVNNSNGHRAGDELLQAIARHWIDEVRHRDTIGRTGGDEFLIVLPNTSLEQAQIAVTRLAVGSPGPWSAGVAMARQGESFDAMLERADRRLYRAKASRQAA